MITECKCEKCGGAIEYEDADIAEGGQTVECPHCGKETVLNSASDQSAKIFVWLEEQEQGPFNEETIQQMFAEGKINRDTQLSLESGGSSWFPASDLFPELAPLPDINNQQEDSGEKSLVEIRLVSGMELKIKAVWLYDEIVLAEINAKRAEAVEKLQGVSTGLGSFGSIGWVLASSVVIGAVEGVLSAGAASSGNSLLTQVLKMEESLRTRGVICPVGKIENIETPHPGLWRVSFQRQVQVEAGVTFLGQKKYEPRQIRSSLIHSGDDFLTVQTDDGSVRSIRWSAVESYAYQPLNSK